MRDVSEWLKADSVRHSELHSLRVDHTLTPGDRESRNWACICGYRFGLLFDNAAKGAYRQHFKDSTSN